MYQAKRNMKKILSFLYVSCSPFFLLAQEKPATDTSAKQLEEIIISFNKWEQNQNEVPNKIVKVTQEQIFRNNPQTSADLLSQTGTIFVQKSQLGGGSPMIRGFATNRVLLVVDGVRMNNAIYRSGNLQNILSVDALALETTEVIFGPGSLIYGSDAIGGVMDFHTLQPRLSTDGKLRVKGSSLVRYSTANKEKTMHADVNLGGTKWSFLTSLTYSSFDDLKMGKNGGPNSYLRPEYVQRINRIDSIIFNPDPRVQRFSGYDQWNLLQKLRFKPGKHLDMVYSFTYARTGDAPRYDRLIQYRNGRLRFAEWNYGPMIWAMHNLQLLHSRKTSLYDEARITAAYQDYEESRIDRARGNNNRTIQTEKVRAYSINADAVKKIRKGELFYGAELVWNKVRSNGERVNITSNSSSAFASRYPDGSTWSTSSLYGSYKTNLKTKLTLTSGVRFSYNTLSATFDNTFIPFPFETASIRKGALTGNAGLVYRPAEGWQINAMISTGYRMPNIDDIGKLFESIPGIITVPNPNLEPEYAWNVEAGIVKHIPGKYRLELNVFHTLLDNAIVRRPSTFNGADSILFNGVQSGVEALQNAARATVSGIQFSADIVLRTGLSFITHANWITGKETDDAKDEQVPLRHAPPFYGSTHIRYQYKKLFTEVYVMYNSELSNNKLAPSEQAKTDIYAKDVNGKPYSPAWHTINLKVSYELSNQWMVNAGWENITNRLYRPYSSGIVAPGSNIILSIRHRF
jgi:hemoglobin/transferrin/lactoferrin receptor protein